MEWKNINQKFLRNLLPQNQSEVEPLTPDEVFDLKQHCRDYEGQLFAMFGLLTPEWAMRLIRARRMPNRNPNWRQVDHYAGAMRRGEWQKNGTTIVITDKYFCADFQHRCLAVIASGVSIPVLFVIGVKDESFGTFDRNLIRTIGQILGMDNEQNCITLAAALRLLWKWETGKLGMSRLHTKPTAHQILEVLKRHQGIRERMHELSSYTRFMPPSCAAFLSYQFGLVDEDKMKEFFDLVKTGVGIDSERNPANILRNKLIHMRARKNTFRSQDQSVVIVYAIKAWNAFIAGKKPRNLGKWDGKTIPEIEGFNRLEKQRKPTKA